MLTTTLNDIRAKSPCEDGWQKLLKHIGKTKADDEPIGFDAILESNGLDDALWCIRALPESMDNDCRLLACDFAEPALKYITNGDERPAKAIWTARQFAIGEATQEELAAVRDAAWAAGAAGAARDAAEAAARAAAWAAGAAWAAARAAARAAEAAGAAGAAGAAAWDAQETIFKTWIEKF